MISRVMGFVCSAVQRLQMEDSSESEWQYCDSECSQCCSDLRSISMADSSQSSKQRKQESDKENVSVVIPFLEPSMFN